MERTPSNSNLLAMLFAPARNDDCHIFVLTTETGPLYGICRFSFDFLDGYVPPADTLSTEENIRGPRRIIKSAPLCFCLLTRNPFFDLHIDLLDSLIALEHLKRAQVHVDHLSNHPRPNSSMFRLSMRASSSVTTSGPSSQGALAQSTSSVLSAGDADQLTSEQLSALGDDDDRQNADDADFPQFEETPYSPDPPASEAHPLTSGSQTSPPIVGASGPSLTDANRLGSPLITRVKRSLSTLAVLNSAASSSAAAPPKPPAPATAPTSPVIGGPRPEALSRLNPTAVAVRPRAQSEATLASPFLVERDPDQESVCSDSSGTGSAAAMRVLQIIRILDQYNTLWAARDATSMRFTNISFTAADNAINLSYAVPPNLPTRDADLIGRWAVPTLFKHLSVDNIILLISLLLQEKKVVFVHSNLHILSACVLSTMPLLGPFQWAMPYVPILPDKLQAVLDAPMPYLVGIPVAPPDLLLKAEAVVHIREDKIKVQKGYVPILLPRHRSLAEKLRPLQTMLRENRLRAGGELMSQKERHSVVQNVIEAFRKHFHGMFSRMLVYSVSDTTDRENPISIFMKETFIDETVAPPDRRFMFLFFETNMFNAFCDEKLRQSTQRAIHAITIAAAAAEAIRRRSSTLTRPDLQRSDSATSVSSSGSASPPQELLKSNSVVQVPGNISAQSPAAQEAYRRRSFRSTETSPVGPRAPGSTPVSAAVAAQEALRRRSVSMRQVGNMGSGSWSPAGPRRESLAVGPQGSPATAVRRPSDSSPTTALRRPSDASPTGSPGGATTASPVSPRASSSSSLHAAITVVSAPPSPPEGGSGIIPLSLPDTLRRKSGIGAALYTPLDRREA
eukprot:TRINITY_DN4191_c0_g1_i1.p1 TRINITY_DN4191_c0_g1~~TRINITY_DN4191_c0_g1_i1.p1  ORF type:complete len:973 (-),score=163.10 TRINITY_DN4191_c0_g1_i1:45-2588(-)